MTEKSFLKTKSAGNPRRSRCLFRRQEGQSSLEFVLVLPVFVLAFLMVVDLGMLMYQYVSVSNAVREGARFGSINCGDGSCHQNDVKDRTIARSSGVLSTHGQVEVGWLDNDGDAVSIQNRGDSVVVRVDHDYDFMFFPGTIPVVSCADMSLEQSDAGISLPPFPALGGC